MKMIYVFKTSVKYQKDIIRLKPYLSELIGEVGWNFDLEDCDNILRVESPKEIKSKIINLLAVLGFDCEELPD
ncbi:hypothetical protein ACFSKL_18585 [Belliella marina]|uniref:Uncharacterized protein n=1 Tax=Belliella marina TaxID=1644146 RepID=A0ABW4VQ29_9BACT